MTEHDLDLLGEHDPDVFAAFEGDLPAEPSALRQRVDQYLPAAVTFVVVLVAWEVLVVALGVKEFILPRPSRIVITFFEEFTTIWGNGWTTLKEALGGFAVGVTLAVLTALAGARWVGVREGVMPFAIAANAVPIVALAPITNAWFSSTSPVSKMAVVAVIVYFPVMINTMRGLVDVEPSELELMRSLAATPREILTKIRVPNALPFFFSALKVASALSLIGAIVAEYFGGRQDALGPYITSKAQLFQFADAWAAILVASIMGMVFYGVILFVERLAMPWHVSLRATVDH